MCCVRAAFSCTARKLAASLCRNGCLGKKRTMLVNGWENDNLFHIAHFHFFLSLSFFHEKMRRIAEEREKGSFSTTLSFIVTTLLSGALLVSLAEVPECRPEGGPGEVVDGEVDGGVEHLEEADEGRDVEEPDGDAEVALGAAVQRAVHGGGLKAAEETRTVFACSKKPFTLVRKKCKK